MQIHDNRGRLIGEINTAFTDKGAVVVTNTVYNQDSPVFQTISVRDNQGEVHTTNVIRGKILP